MGNKKRTLTSNPMAGMLLFPSTFTICLLMFALEIEMCASGNVL